MTFYEEVRSFFQKYDPARIRLAKKIASAYKTPKSQKAVMRRLKEVYAAGGPSKFDFAAGKTVAPKMEAKVEEVVEQLGEEVSEQVEEIKDIEGNDGLEEITG